MDLAVRRHLHDMANLAAAAPLDSPQHELLANGFRPVVMLPAGRGYVAVGGDLMVVGVAASLPDSLWDPQGYQLTPLPSRMPASAFDPFVQDLWMVYKYVRRAVSTVHNHRTVCVVGYGTGGAVAALLGFMLVHDLRRRVGVATFGAPAPGDEQFARGYGLLAPLTYRVVCGTDPVPLAPDQAHVGREVRLTREGAEVGPAARWVWGQALRFKVKAQDPSDHDISSYIEATRAFGYGPGGHRPPRPWDIPYAGKP